MGHARGLDQTLGRTDGSKRNPDVFLKADKDVPYGTVVEIMGEVKEAGIEKLGMVTEPKISFK
jgi:biopolymer transport protein TolR